MKNSIFCIILVLLFGGAVSGFTAIPVQTAQDDDHFSTFLPLVFLPSPVQENAIIIDHRHTDIAQIPPEWIAQAKNLTVHFAHTSHGSQIISGLDWLESRDAIFNVAHTASGTVTLPTDSSALRIYQGNNYPSTTYITPDLYWESTDGQQHTRSVVETGWFDFSLWTWCGQMSYYSGEQIQTYLNTLNALDNDYGEVKFIFFTGHTDGTQSGSTLWSNNNLVRNFAQTNRQILFDFADIESYDPAGTFYPTASDGCAWCDDWCASHPQDCQSLPSSCAHSHPLQCKLKAQAFWWLMARLAGWDGTPVQ